MLNAHDLDYDYDGDDDDDVDGNLCARIMQSTYYTMQRTRNKAKKAQLECLNSMCNVYNCIYI